MKNVIRSLVLTVVLLGASFATASQDAELELRSQGLVCKVVYDPVLGQNGSWSTVPRLTAGNGYTYFDPTVEMQNGKLLVSIKARFYRCSYGRGTEGAWAITHPLKWQHLVVAPTDSFEKNQTVTGEYAASNSDQSVGEFKAQSALNLSSLLSKDQLESLEAGKSASGVFFVSVGNGKWNKLGGIYAVNFRITSAGKAYVEELSFWKR